MLMGSIWAYAHAKEAHMGSQTMTLANGTVVELPYQEEMLEEETTLDFLNVSQELSRHLMSYEQTLELIRRMNIQEAEIEE